MLGQHPQMYDALETQIFDVSDMMDWRNRFGVGRHDGDGLRRLVAEVVFGSQYAATINRASRWLYHRQSWRPNEILNAIIDKLHPLILVEKTPLEKGDMRVSLENRAKIFPMARYVHLVRHPFNQSRSLLEHLNRMAISEGATDIYDRFARITDNRGSRSLLDPQHFWQKSNSCIMDFLSTVPESRKIRVRGEDLIAHPDRTLGDLVRHFGLRSDTRAIEEMKHPERSPFAFIGPKNASFGADPKFLRQSKLRSVESLKVTLLGPLPWREDGSGFTEEVCELAKTFGYT